MDTRKQETTSVRESLLIQVLTEPPTSVLEALQLDEAERAYLFA
jgi:hypothetical protein